MSISQVIFQTNLQAAKKYCLFRYNQEQKLEKFKEQFLIDQKELLHDLMEEGLSIRKINSCRIIFEKSLETSDVTSPNDPILSNFQKAEAIFQFIVTDFGNSRNSAAFKHRYYEAEHKILSYYSRYYDIQDLINAEKNKNKFELSVLRDEMISDGVPHILLQYVYKRFRTDINGLKTTTREELDHFSSIYNSLRDEMIEEIKNV